MSLYVALAGLGFLVLLLGRLIGQYRAYQRLRSSVPRGLLPVPVVSVIIPARNEAHNIGRCVRALLSQDYPALRYEVLVVDDGSTDDTAAIVRGLAAQDPRVRLLQAGPLPAGWTGKPHACFQGAQAARGRLLCFMDADTTAAPSLLSESVALLCARGVAMLSLHPRQEMGTFWERLVLPAHLLLFAVATNIRRVHDPKDEEAMANGQFILMRRDAYAVTGGHAAVRGEILEDFALARVLKRAGYRLLLCCGEDLISTRMYTDLRSLVRGFAKNTVAILGGVPAACAGALGCLLLGWLPVGLLLAAALPGPAGGTGTRGAVGALALLLALAVGGTHAGFARRYGAPLRHGLLFPLGFTLAAGIALRSIGRALHGRNEWKGRVYETQAAAAAPVPSSPPAPSLAEAAAALRHSGLRGPEPAL